VLCGHDGRRGFLNHLAVDAAYRGRGIGRALSRRCLALLAAEGIVKCTILVFTENTDGQVFWIKEGYGPHPDLLMMQAWTAAPTPAEL
jgi:ribosomal protein S18 acetylase RimI-like enzyme